MPIKIQCKCRIIDEFQIWTRNYANSLKELRVVPKENDPYEYTAIFNFSGKSDPLIIKLVAKGLCPRVKLSSSILHFGECNINDHREIEVEIKNNKDIPIDYRL
jgi:hypothetical protein